MPVMCGSITQSTATAVIAASAALPPARSTSIAASVASGCEVAAMPSPAMTGERPGRWKSRLMETTELETSGHRRIGPVDLDVALRRARRDDEAASTSTNEIVISKKKVDVPARATSRNSTSITMNRIIDRM